MRRILRVLPLFALALACTKSTISPPVRLDFVGASRFTSGSRTVSTTTPADTLASKIYAQVPDLSANSATDLTRLQILLSSSPSRTPILYSTVGVALVTPAADAQLVYLDSTLPAHSKDIAFTNLLSDRTTSGVDLWEYTATDDQGRSASRAYRLALRRPDSVTAVLHSYRLYLSPVPYRSATALTPAQNRAFAYVGLRQGLLLPHFAVATPAANRPLIDLVCVSSGTDVRLAAITSTSLARKGWPTPNNTTELRSTTLTATDFAGFNSNILLLNAFNASTPYPAGAPFGAQVTSPLIKNTVITFLTTDSQTKAQRYGALFIADLVRTPTVVATCQVVVQK